MNATSVFHLFNFAFLFGVCGFLVESEVEVYFKRPQAKDLKQRPQAENLLIGGVYEN